MKRTILCLLLAFGLLAGMMTLEVAATEELHVSDAGVAFIREMMANELSTNQLSAAESAVNGFASRYGLSLRQTQFDALVDFVMAYGSYVLTNGYQCETLIGSGSYTDLEIANAFCAWVKNGASFDQARLTRRLREIKLFLYDDYTGTQCVPTFRYLIFNGNGGSPDDNTVLCYTLDAPYGALPTATRSGKYFAGWYTAASGGTHICNGDTVTQNHTVYAHWSDEAVESPNEKKDGDGTSDLTPPELKTTEAGVQFIKDHEGFLQYAVWDYSQYSIGYGSRCEAGEFPDGITEEEADYRLRVMLADFEKVVDAVLEKGTVEHTPQQYDAIMSFTYNLGRQWMKEDNQIYRFILYGGYENEMEFVNAIGKWINAGGTPLDGLARRRMSEANLYLNGEYAKTTGRYMRLTFNAMSGEAAYNYAYYRTGEPLGALPTATRAGYRLIGWFDKVAGGTQYTAETTAPGYANYTVYAQWEESDEPVTDAPTDTTEPTESTTGAPTDTTEPPTEEPTEPPTEPPTEAPTEPPHEDFSDVSQSSWYYTPVMTAVNRGLFSGISETEFSPDTTMTRAMLVTVLYRMDGSPETTASAPFTDVPQGMWFSKAVDWAYEKGVVNGISATEFGLELSVTREQLTTMLFRYAAACGYDTSARAELTAFADAAQVSDYANGAIRWAVAWGILNGYDGKLLPAGEATRAQCAKMLTVFLDKCGEQA